MQLVNKLPGSDFIVMGRENDQYWGGWILRDLIRYFTSHVGRTNRFVLCVPTGKLLSMNAKEQLAFNHARKAKSVGGGLALVHQFVGLLNYEPEGWEWASIEELFKHGWCRYDWKAPEKWFDSDKKIDKAWKEIDKNNG